MSISPSILEEFEYTGVWWLPDNPENKLPGTLKFNQLEGAVLRLDGLFENISEKNLWNLLYPEIILGVSFTGENISLYKCFENKREVSGHSTSSFYANFVFIGVHFQNKKEIKFKDLSIHFTYLNEWFDANGFSIEEILNSDGTIIRYKKPQSVKIDAKGISIKFETYWSYSSETMKRVTIQQKVYITIEKTENDTFENLRAAFYPIQNFLTLGVNNPVYPLEVKGRIHPHSVKNENGRKFSPSINVYYKLFDIQKIADGFSPRMLFNFNAIKEDPSFFLKKWLRSSEELKPVHDLYFDVVYNSHMFLEEKFLSLARALEVFHARTCGGKYLPDEEYKHIYNALVNKIPEEVEKDFKENLKSKLKYGNEFSLRKRLKDIFNNEECKEILSRLIKDKKDFINKVTTTRNYLTHYNGDLKAGIVQGEKLYFLTQKMEKVIKTCLLKEAGFSIDKVRNMMQSYFLDEEEF